ncbi:MAG: aminotransferase class V-fold PLP-dependent enzyme, partial [Planctomycetes bacterium]|nr:aminotransferase class V-fold PLP-dependent enzyme [Planctomycetota bacterium]
MTRYHTHVSTERGSPLSDRWVLDPQVVFLNHGSFGACPHAVLQYQSELRTRLERQPVDFFVRRYYPLLDEARHSLADFLGAEADGLTFVPNATTGVNCVLRSMDLEPGDELLISDHAYNACRNAIDYVAERAAAKVVVVPIPFPVTGDDEIVTAVVGRVTDRTRLLLIDHVTSATGLVLPLTRIVKDLAARGIDTLVDGAHAPGMLPLDLDGLGAAYYTGNCHKWICAPKGSAFLWVREDLRQRVRPSTISHGANMPETDRSRFRHEFDWIGTTDPTAWLSVPEALRVMDAMLPGGWPDVMRTNRDLALKARAMLADRLGLELPCPDSMIGSIASLHLTEGPANPPSPLYEDPLQVRLWEEDRIEVPIGPFPTPPQRLLRSSAQLYNTMSDYEILAEALARELQIGSRP